MFEVGGRAEEERGTLISYMNKEIVKRKKLIAPLHSSPFQL